MGVAYLNLNFFKPFLYAIDFLLEVLLTVGEERDPFGHNGGKFSDVRLEICLEFRLQSFDIRLEFRPQVGDVRLELCL